jgi:hypothetical protein
MYFDLYKEKIRLRKDDIDVPEILDLIEGLDDDKALKIVLYIFLLYDRTDENPIRELPIKEREKEALEITGINFKDYDESKLNLAIHKFKGKAHKLQHDIDAYDKKLFEFIDLLADTDPDIIKNTHEVSGKISFSTNIDIITTALDNSLNIIMDKIILTDMKRSGKFVRQLRGKLSSQKQKKLLNKIKNESET